MPGERDVPKYPGLVMPTYLEGILAAHRQAAELDRRPLDELVAAARRAPRTRPFATALASGGGLAVIAEIKRRSPSRGALAPDLVPADLAQAYARGGAAALSVLTDARFFGARPHDLAEARAAVHLPVLRKDFTVSPRDVCDARLMGADAVLLIAAALDDQELASLHQLAVALGMDALVEVHDEAELGRALDVGAVLVGVNQRDLTTFDVDAERAVRLANLIPDSVVSVAESGIGGPLDAAPLRAAGYDAVLVGESLVSSPDPSAAVRRLATVARALDEGAAQCS